MGNYLDAYVSSLPVGQRDAILKLIEQDRSGGLIGTREQAEVEFQKLMRALIAGKEFDLGLKLLFANEYEASKITSTMFNDNFKAVFVALHGLFLQMDRADQTITRHRVVRDSDFAKIKAATNKLLEDLSVYQYLRTAQGEWTEVKYSNFWNRRNANKSLKAADVDEQTKNLRLRIGDSHRIHQLAGSAPTRASAEGVGSGGYEGISRGFKPQNALDNKLSTFWAHLVMADDPLRTTIYDVEYDGALVWFITEFPAVEVLSTIRLLPFGSHPIRVARIEYWDGEAWQEVEGVSLQAASLDWQHYGFRQVMTNKIRILLNQPNYTKNTYVVPRRLFTKALLWDMVLDQTLLHGVEEEDLTASQSIAVNTNPRFRALVSAMKRFSDRLGESGLDINVESSNEIVQTLDAATMVMAGTREDDADIVMRDITGETAAKELAADDTVEITKCEYLLGLYQISIEHRDYFPIGVYESPKYDNQGTVFEVALDVEESHVQGEDSNGATYPLSSVEYNIEVSPERRVPVVPYGDTRVPQELLKVDPNTLKAELRFTPHATPNMSLRKDGEVNTSWSLSGKTLTITAGFNKNCVYTAAYDVQAGQDSIDLDALYNSIALVKPEQFTETDDRGMLKLSYYPYIAWEIINDSENWVKPDKEQARYIYRVENGDVTIDGITYGAATSKEKGYEPIRVLVNGILAKNITDYRNREHPAFVEAQGQSLVYQYIHVGRKLYFNRPITGAQIEVNYRWMSQYVRLVATLRGHQAVFNPYTPLVDSFRLKMKTSRL